MNKRPSHQKGSGNVYKDMDLPDAEQRLAKAKLAMRIEDVIKKRSLKQIEAADILGVSQPKISALLNGQLRGFSMERLIGFLNKLDQDVLIVIKMKPTRRKSHGHLKVAFA